MPKGNPKFNLDPSLHLWLVTVEPKVLSIIEHWTIQIKKSVKVYPQFENPKQPNRSICFNMKWRTNHEG